MARPKQTSEVADSIRAEICAAAARLYDRNGYEAVTLRAIAAEMGRSQALPYRYFKNKDHIFAALRANCFDRLSDRLLAATAVVDEPLAKVYRMVMSFTEFAITQPAEFRLMYSLRQPNPAHFPELQAARLRTLAVVQDAYQFAASAGRLRGDAIVGAHITWASFHGLLSLHLASQLNVGLSLDDLIEPMLDTLFGPGTVATAKAARERPPVVPESPSDHG